MSTVPFRLSEYNMFLHGVTCVHFKVDIHIYPTSGVICGAIRT